MNVLDNGGSLTARATDGRATAYTAGFVHQSTISSMTDMNVFGYFLDQGFVCANPDTAQNEDYSTCIDCLISSGVAIVSNDAVAGPGLTGNRFIGGGIYGADHHTRDDGWYSGSEEVNVLYIDGLIGSNDNGIRGHAFIGTQLRGYVNNAISLDHCDDISFDSCIYEFSTLAGIAGADSNGVFAGTSNTLDIRVISPASTNEMGLAAFANAIGGSLILIGGADDQSITVVDNGNAVRINGDGSLGDSVIQFTDDISSSANGWSIRRDGSDSEHLKFQFGGATMLYVDATSGDINFSSGVYNAPHIVLGNIHIFKNANDLRISNGAPTSSTDGALLGTAT